MAGRRGLSVAVVGGGAAGIAACRALVRQGHKAVVLERSAEGVGGTWRYSEGGSETGSSMYANLSTNLSKAVMQFSDCPFPDDVPAHPHHTHVLQYLDSFWRSRGLDAHTRLGCHVKRCEPPPAREPGRWRVVYDQAGQERVLEADALVVANGHYTVPFEPPLEGRETTGCRVMHAHEYRRPDAFKGLRVLVVGGGYSGVDIANELSSVCSRVSLSVRGQARHQATADKVAQRIRDSGKDFVLEESPAFGGRRPELKRLVPGSQRVEFVDGSEAEVDVVLLCTGYRYSFPFLPDGLVDVGLRTVEPLYEDVFHCDFPNGTLSFVGVPWQVVPFPLCEIQSAWIARVLAGEARLPPPGDMHASIRARLAFLEDAGLPRRLLHRGGSGGDHATYCRRVVAHAGLEGVYNIFDDRSLRPAEAT